MSPCRCQRGQHHHGQRQHGQRHHGQRQHGQRHHGQRQHHGWALLRR